MPYHILFTTKLMGQVGTQDLFFLIYDANYAELAFNLTITWFLSSSMCRLLSIINLLYKLCAHVVMVKSKSTLITTDGDNLLRWKKRVCSAMVFSTSHLLAYLRMISTTTISKSLVIIKLKFNFTVPHNCDLTHLFAITAY